MLLLATTRPSDGIDHEVYVVAAVLFYSACFIGLLALIFTFTLRKYPRIVLTFSFLTLILAIFPFAFWSYIYHIDYVEVGGDGTRPSPPFWKALWLPALLLITGATLTVSSAITAPQTRRKIWRRIWK